MTKIKRRFIPGEEWAYYKIYCGPKTADDLLTGCIKTGVGEMLVYEIINRWFFIRYSDPELHLRIRFSLTHKNYMNDLIQRFNMIIQPHVNSERIHNVQMDTYEREVERYGEKTVEHSERLFYYDSELVVDALELLKYAEDENLKWMFALKSIDRLLDDFKYGLDQKVHLLEQLRNGFAREFNMERVLKKQLDQKYRNFKGQILELFGNNFGANGSGIEVEQLLKIRSHKSRRTIASIKRVFQHDDNQDQTDSFISSHIHMSINRIFRTRQRMHEMVLYDFLFRYYKSELAKLKYKNPV